MAGTPQSLGLACSWRLIAPLPSPGLQFGGEVLLEALVASSIDIRDAAAISLLTEVAQCLQLVHSRCGEAYLAYLCTALLPRMGWPPEAAQQLVTHITGACGRGGMRVWEAGSCSGAWYGWGDERSGGRRAAAACGSRPTAPWGWPARINMLRPPCTCPHAGSEVKVLKDFLKSALQQIKQQQAQRQQQQQQQQQQ